LNATHYYKFLYSTGTEYSRTLSSINVRTQTVNSTSTSFDWGTYVDQSYLDPTGVVHQISSDDLVFSFTNTSTTAFAGNYTWTYDSPWVEWDHSPFLVTGEDAVSPYYYFETEAGTTDFNVTTVSNSTATLDFNLSAVELYWDISFDPSGPLFTDLKSIYFDSFNADYQVEITVSYNMTTGNYTVSAAIIFGAPDEGYSAGYDYYLPGGYEWVAVGRDASTVDSAGATVVAAAFKNKGVEIYNSAMDMNGLTYQYQIPYLLTKMTSGLTPDFQNYWITPDQSSPGQRLSLADDWCTKYPVSSSNIISVGGPLANQITEYFNSFTSAFYAEPWFTPYTPWKGTLVSLPCWSKDVYANSGGQNGTGYATIGTYLDLNGTVGLVIYGLDARDTFYATKFFYQDIIQEFQSFPAGATSIVIKISYTDPKHPTFTIPEVLGTISETLVEGIKGGIHPDP
jgi:hypothetical protein